MTREVEIVNHADANPQAAATTRAADAIADGSGVVITGGVGVTEPALTMAQRVWLCIHLTVATASALGAILMAAIPPDVYAWRADGNSSRGSAGLTTEPMWLSPILIYLFASLLFSAVVSAAAAYVSVGFAFAVQQDSLPLLRATRVARVCVLNAHLVAAVNLPVLLALLQSAGPRFASASPLAAARAWAGLALVQHAVALLFEALGSRLPVAPLGGSSTGAVIAYSDDEMAALVAAVAAGTGMGAGAGPQRFPRPSLLSHLRQLRRRQQLHVQALTPAQLEAWTELISASDLAPAASFGRIGRAACDTADDEADVCAICLCPLDEPHARGESQHPGEEAGLSQDDLTTTREDRASAGAVPIRDLRLVVPRSSVSSTASSLGAPTTCPVPAATLVLPSHPTSVPSTLLRRLPCLHTYHVACADSWLLLHPHCPMCRGSVAVLGPARLASRAAAVAAAAARAKARQQGLIRSAGPSRRPSIRRDTLSSNTGQSVGQSTRPHKWSYPASCGEQHNGERVSWTASRADSCSGLFVSSTTASLLPDCGVDPPWTSTSAVRELSEVGSRECSLLRQQATTVWVPVAAPAPVPVNAARATLLRVTAPHLVDEAVACGPIDALHRSVLALAPAAAPVPGHVRRLHRGGPGAVTGLSMLLQLAATAAAASVEDTESCTDDSADECADSDTRRRLGSAENVRSHFMRSSVCALVYRPSPTRSVSTLELPVQSRKTGHVVPTPDAATLQSP
jgi:hypothetical protein